MGIPYRPHSGILDIIEACPPTGDKDHMSVMTNPRETCVRRTNERSRAVI